ncbi:MAG: phosphoribosyltransferase [bacterium]|nr:phosphoribosyltransferase [bacterium]
MEYLPFSWEDAEKASASLTEKINSSGFSPDIIIAISRGGLIPARLLSDFLNVPVLYTIRISFYSSVGVRREKPEVTQPLSVDIKGKKILIVDDIADSGKSLELAEQYIIPLNPAEIKTATIHYKPGSIVKPDFFVSTTEAWVIYPWERAEFTRETGKRVEEI